MSDHVLGIDLGTTFSAVAYVNETGLVEMIPNREGQTTTPSVVLIEDGRFVVGQAAVSQAVAKPSHVAQCIKRWIGDADFKFQGIYTPEQVSAEILRKLVADAEDYLGEPVKRAVITVPAYFTGSPLAKTKMAGEMAGLIVEDLLPEPEAAAIHFGIDHLQDNERVLVCDLGGGTYDATVLEMRDGVLKSLKTRGSRELGGHDWTEVMMQMLIPLIEQETGNRPDDNPADWQRLYDLCESTKRQLSTTLTANVPWSDVGKAIQLTVTNEQYEARCEALMNQVLDKTSEAIQQSNLTTKDINYVLLVGGSSRLPSFAACIEKLVGIKPRKTRYADEAVARGAALVAHGYATGDTKRATGKLMIFTGQDRANKIMVQRRTSHALGTLMYERNGNVIEFVPEPIIAENADIPVLADSAGRVEPGQTTLQVPVLQLDSQGRRMETLGNYRFDDLPQRNHEYRVRIQFEYDAQGIPKVSAFDEVTGKQLAGTVAEFQEPTAEQRLGAGQPQTGTITLAKRGDSAPLMIKSRGGSNIDTIHVKLNWKMAVDLDLHAFYRTKSGNSGHVYFANKGQLSQAPFMELDDDMGVGNTAGDNEENLRIGRLEHIQWLLIATNIYGNKQGDSFVNYDGFVRVNTGSGGDVEVPLSSDEPGVWCLIAKIDNSGPTPRLINLNEVCQENPEDVYL